ncbi:lysylphosphatidylglycerol synthase domain-containing protein [Pseudodesulfovibrio sediminis]|uniref:Flippase-like domain-containing protein n=1 Tax=Pseudodesulfovibrio sediminis TaxID=2810563 RepID=A0ABN6ERN8_9BACT|nr:lysylphosphatidylglycerol synthase domain-containing protein [Pseudodesulfovibrio sediminis]BCS87538.1 hypothetical protein PSDVSF_07800 [Pseudodesulfovibrio sediminis]
MVLTCLGLVGVQVYRYAPELSSVLVRDGVASTLALASCVYAAALALLALAWHLLLRRVFGGAASFKSTYGIYARTSIAKYLPGNVGHVVGRQVVGKSKGLSHVAIAGSSVLEVVCLVCVAALICLWMELPIATPIPAWVYFVASILLLLAVPVVVMVFARKRNVEALIDKSFRQLYTGLGLVSLLDLLFFLVTGSLLYLISLGAGLDTGMSLFSVVAVYAVSWFLGLITPGAPAGAGVREAIIIAMLGLTMKRSDALAVALLFRIMTTAGDVLFFGTSFLPWVRERNQQHSTPSSS